LVRQMSCRHAGHPIVYAPRFVAVMPFRNMGCCCILQDAAGQAYDTAAQKGEQAKGAAHDTKEQAKGAAQDTKDQTQVVILD
jgi:hypothetical protein